MKYFLDFSEMEREYLCHRKGQLVRHFLFLDHLTGWRYSIKREEEWIEQWSGRKMRRPRAGDVEEGRKGKIIFTLRMEGLLQQLQKRESQGGPVGGSNIQTDGWWNNWSNRDKFNKIYRKKLKLRQDRYMVKPWGKQREPVRTLREMKHKDEVEKDKTSFLRDMKERTRAAHPYSLSHQ